VGDIVIDQRLEHVVVGALMQRFDNTIDTGMSGDEDDQGLGRDSTNLAQQPKPIKFGHAQVGYDQIEITCLNRRPAGFAIVSRSYGITFFTQNIDQRFATGLFVINN